MSSDTLEKIAIMSLETSVVVRADYNPKELSFDKKATWTDDSSGTNTDFPSLQFTAGAAMTVSVELLFDAYESDDRDVRPAINGLLSLALIDDSLKRPPMVKVVWGSSNIIGSGQFTGVVESVTTKYTMFTSDGVPCRATATVSIKQAEEVSVNASSHDGGSEKLTTKVYNSPSDITDADREAILAVNPDFKEENTTFPYVGRASSGK